MPCGANSRRQGSRPQIRILDVCADVTVTTRAASHTNALAAICAQTRADARRRLQHTPSHAASLKRADSCIVAFKVKHIVAHAAGHRQRTWRESRTLTCVQAQYLLHTRPHARSLTCPHVRRRAQHAPSHALSHRRVDTCVIASRRRTHGGSRGRPSGQARALLRVLSANVAARAASHANDLVAIHAGTRDARTGKRCLTSVLTYATSANVCCA